MLPMHELLSHAELSQSKPVSAEVLEVRQSPRRPRCGNLTLFPRVTGMEPLDSLEDEPSIAASLSNISTEGLGLVHCDELPTGLEFDIQWHAGESYVPLRFQVVHSRRTSLGLYRTGARLIAGELPTAPPPIQFAPVNLPTYEPAETSSQVVIETEPAPTENPITPPTVYSGIMKYEPEPAIDESPAAAALPGTFPISSAFGADKTENLPGATTCGWERSLEIRRVGDRFWLYIHSPGKKNGWGIYVNANQFQSAFDRVQQAAQSPFITTLAA